MPNYIVTMKIFLNLFPKKIYNKKNFFWVKKLLLFHPYLPVFCTLKVIHIFAQTFNHNIDLFTACFHAKTVDYNDHFSSSSFEQLISFLFQTRRGWQAFWTPCSRLRIKQAFPLPASVSIGWPGPWKPYLMHRREYPCLSKWADPTTSDLY